MKWTIEQVHLLSKKVYGNFNDEELLKLAVELNIHLKKYDESFLALHNKHERAEVERLAAQINENIRLLQKERGMSLT